ncbi:type II toxin-antitoxin system ParD family antitoxin [Jiella endophytica]|uniref:Type II toxin-antitoxin system ParD family antitoxin n=1 Tax=Jiella endophytica TaxID=2558362 RepID=A0A4Y8RAH8_9HYPH|nr:type II toxin-antitoxin system CcdA family antitoxin [Jiella endophytica]TFF17869.1 type II toxin-antitoxin system ParD family antitoxin [Jiella endophytica]
MNDVVIDPALLAEAEALDIDIPAAAAKGVEEAVRAARKSRSREDKIAAMQRLVDEALASGIGSRSPEELFADAEARARQG